MQGGIVGSLCFLAFLFSAKAEELTTPIDLKPVVPESISSFSQDESRSGAQAESSAFSDGGSSQSDAFAESSGGSSSAQSLASSSGYGNSKANALSDNELQASPIFGLGSNRGYPYHVPGSSSAQASAEAQASSSNGYTPPIPYPPVYSPSAPSSYPSGLMPLNLNSPSFSQAEAEAQATSGGQYNLPSPYSVSHYGSGLNSAQEQGLNSYTPSPFSSGLSPLSGSNVAQAEASAQASSGRNSGFGPSSYSPGDNLLVIPSGTNALGSQAQAQAQAQSLSQTMGGWGNPNSPGLSPISPYSGSSSAQAQANAEAQVGGGSNPYNPYSVKPSSFNPSPFNPSYSPRSSASALAEAHASNGGVSPYNSGLSPYYPPQSPQSPYNYGSSSASASAEAMANGAGSLPYNPSGPLVPGFPFFPNGQSAQSHAAAQAQSTLGANQYGQGLQPSGYYPGSVTQAQAEANAQASSNSVASSSASANAFSGVQTRPLQPQEYIYPNNNGGETGYCRRLHEIIHMTSFDGGCLVCFCIGDVNQGNLYPICASCATCKASEPHPFPIPVTPESIPYPEPYPVPFPEPYSVTTPLPIPEVSVTCAPLPSGKTFTNPLNPCQLCICMESMSALGKPDVQIQCQENPQCVIPPNVTPIPVVPDVPVPIPLPLCEKFPSNVLFPHPSDVCKLCKCSVELSEFGLPERHITCFPNPECIRPEPIPFEPITASPMPYPYTPDIRPVPIPFPEALTIAPIPWPVTTPGPMPAPARGPLPGPSPHESCRPFPPNQPFQHPWDDCQVCLCTEAYTTGMITVEVNCYTKKSCCVETPNNYIPVTLPPPAPYPNPGTILIKDNVCEFKTFGIEFSNPENSCQVCMCLPNNGVVSMSCKQLYTPECLPYPGGSTNAEAQASAQASAETFNGLVPFTGNTLGPSPYSPSPYSPSPYSPYSPGTQSSASASAEANAVISGPQSPYLPSPYSPAPYSPSRYSPYSPGTQSSASASAEANAVISGPHSPYYLPEQGRPNDGYPGNQVEAQAQAQAQALSQGSGQSSASAEAEAYANSGSQQQTYGSNLTPGSYISPGGFVDYSGSISSAEAQAQAQAQAQAHAQAQAQAEAQAQAQDQIIRFKYPSYGGYDQRQTLSNGISGLNYNHYGPRVYQGRPYSGLYPTLYSRPSQEVYQPGQIKESSAQGQAQSQSYGSNAKSQASALATAGGKYQTKSGRPDDDAFD